MTNVRKQRLIYTDGCRIECDIVNWDRISAEVHIVMIDHIGFDRHSKFVLHASFVKIGSGFGNTVEITTCNDGT